jgi:hypothetical protein
MLKELIAKLKSCSCKSSSDVNAFKESEKAEKDSKS